MQKLKWPAPERNKQPILEVLERVLPPAGTVLELASGTGQHAAYFARHLPALTFQPSDIDHDNLVSIAAWTHDEKLSNVAAPLRIDVCDEAWPIGQVQAIYSANLIHIAPWRAAEGLVRGAARHLVPGGLLVIYGPFRIGGQHTALSNQTFDEELRRRDPAFGVRDLEQLLALVAEHGFTLRERVAMPANNQLLLLVRA